MTGAAGPVLDAVRVLLCDADGNLFPSEEPAFEASTEVTNAFLADLGVDRVYVPAELRAAALGRNFRGTMLMLAAEHGIGLDGELAAQAGAEPADPPALTAGELGRRAVAERVAVTAHLAEVLRPDPEVREPLARLAGRFALAVVSSSATPRLDACFTATDLAALLPADARFSAEDSLPEPTSKPDPAVYRLAGERLGVAGGQALAIEDAVAGVRSAVGAGFPCVGNVQFVGEAEREQRTSDLRAAGAGAVVASWGELEALLEDVPGRVTG